MSDEQGREKLQRLYADSLNRLCKWRTVFVGWMLGTVPDGTPGLQAHKDRIDRHLMYRVELNAILAILIEKKITTKDEWMAQVIEECECMQKILEETFPGYQATEYGMQIDPKKAVETNKRMGFPW